MNTYKFKIKLAGGTVTSYLCLSAIDMDAAYDIANAWADVAGVWSMDLVAEYR